MSGSPIRPRWLALAAAGAVAAGVISGAAEGGDKPRAPRSARPAVPLPAPRALPAPVPCRPRRAADRKPPSEALLRAFGVLRRERTDRDALPASALAALKRHGLEPVDPASARLLRDGPGVSGAWIVPVPDVNAGFGPRLGCRPVLVPRAAPPPSTLRRPRPRTLRPPRRVPRVRRLPPPAYVLPPTAYVEPPPSTAPALPAPTPRAFPAPPMLPAPLWAGRPPLITGPQEGVAVVSIGGVPGGGGGALRDLLRGRAPVSVDPCAGPRRDMVGISGVVPDGVEAAFLTSEDGSAVRADVANNSFAFVVPRDRRPQQRYVVWSGADGTPHVQPVFVPFQRGRRFCPRLPERIARLPRVSPGVFDHLGPGGLAVSGFFAPAPAPRPSMPAPLPDPSYAPRRRFAPPPAPRYAPPPSAVPPRAPRHAPPPAPRPAPPAAPRRPR